MDVGRARSCAHDSSRPLRGAFIMGLWHARIYSGRLGMALTESTMELALGTEAPDFGLTDVVTGKTVRRDDVRGEKGLLVMFICAHCPYVKHVEKGLAALG